MWKGKGLYHMAIQVVPYGNILHKKGKYMNLTIEGENETYRQSI